LRKYHAGLKAKRRRCSATGSTKLNGTTEIVSFPIALRMQGVPESFYILACQVSAKSEFNISYSHYSQPERPLETMHCLRCNRQLDPGHKSVALYMFAQTVGIKPRQKSAAHRI
jgi:hypothetical protein